MKLQQAHPNVVWCQQRMKASRFGAVAVLAAMAMGPVVGQAPSDAEKSKDLQAASVAGAASGSNRQAQENDLQTGKPVPEAASGERKNPIVEDSARLLQMATELKSEVDKTTKDMLSMDVIHKAEQIEKLAHSVREKKRPMIGAN